MPWARRGAPRGGAFVDGACWRRRREGSLATFIVDPEAAFAAPDGRAGARHAGPSLATARKSPGHGPGMLGLRARRHYPPAPRSDDAISWRSRLRQGAARVAAGLDVGRGARIAAVSGQGTHAGQLARLGEGMSAGPTSDAYLQTLRSPGCRRSGRLGYPPKRAGRCVTSIHRADSASG